MERLCELFLPVFQQIQIDFVFRDNLRICNFSYLKKNLLHLCKNCKTDHSIGLNAVFTGDIQQETNIMLVIVCSTQTNGYQETILVQQTNKAYFDMFNVFVIKMYTTIIPMIFVTKCYHNDYFTFVYVSFIGCKQSIKCTRMYIF